MSPRHTRRRSVVLVFGESINDAQSIATLIQGLRPDLVGRVKPVPRPTSLTRQAGQLAVRNWEAELRSVVTAMAAAGQPVAAVVVHRDADRPDPAGAVEAGLRQQLRGIADEVAVPVETMEAWWLLFPEATETVRPRAWRGRLPRQARDVERISHPKAELQRKTRPSGHQYAEADSPTIAAAISTRSHVAVGISSSWDRLQASAGRLPTVLRP